MFQKSDTGQNLSNLKLLERSAANTRDRSSFDQPPYPGGGGLTGGGGVLGYTGIGCE